MQLRLRLRLRLPRSLVVLGTLTVILAFAVLVAPFDPLATPLQTLAQGGTPEPTPVVFEALPEPQPDTLDEAVVAEIDLRALPILPNTASIAGWLGAIYAEGQRLGLNADVFTKIGDCMSSSPNFLAPLATDDLDLGAYSDLAPIIARFSAVAVRAPDSGLNSLTNTSLAAASGFNAAAVLDATWSDPAHCEGNESPLVCELRLVQPAFAFLMFGTNDLRSLTPVQFDYFLRRVVVETVNAGVVPILSTFPNQPGQIERSIVYNQVVAAVAADYQIPLINLWLAFDPLPEQGIDPAQPTHMTLPPSGNAASFAESDLQAGHNVHNLLSMQILARIVEAIEGVEAS